MNTQDPHIIDVTPDITEDSPAPEKAPRSGSRGVTVLLALTLILLAAVGGALFYTWQHWQGARAELEDLHERTQAAQRAQQEMLDAIAGARKTLEDQEQNLRGQQETLDRQAALISEQDGEIRANQQRLSAERLGLAEARAEMDQRLASVTRRIEGDPHRWILAEAASLLRQADARLELKGDRVGALAALRRADGLLARGGDRLVRVRELLAQEIAEVEAYRPPDVRQVERTLRKLEHQARDLPLKAAVLPQPPAPDQEQDAAVQAESATVPAWRHAANRSLGAVRGLVTVRRTSPGRIPTLTGPYETWLRQSLKLNLDNARVGALDRNSALYLAGIEAAAGILGDFYAPGGPRDEVAARLEKLAARPLATEPPRIGAALTALEAVQNEAAP